MWLAPLRALIAHRYFDRPLARSTWGAAEWSRAVAAAVVERLGPCLGEAAATAGLDPPVSDWALLTAARVNNERRSARHATALHELAAAFEADGVVALVFKGPATARHYPDPAVRESSDIDLLVPDGHMPRVAAVLDGLGYELTLGDSDDPLPYAVVYTRYADVEPISVEVHPAWHEVTLTPDGEHVEICQATYEIDRIDLRGSPWRVLPPTPELYLAVAHTALHNPRTLSLYLDVGILAGGADPATLDQVRELARLNGRERHLRHALSGAADLFGLDISGEDTSLPRRLRVPVSGRLGYIGFGRRLLPSTVLTELAWRRGWSRKRNFLRWLAGHGQRSVGDGADNARRVAPRGIQLIRGLKWLRGRALRY